MPENIFGRVTHTASICIFLLIFSSAFLYGQTAEERKRQTEALLDMTLEELLNVQVKIASRSQQSLEDAPGIVSVITAGEIERMGARDLRDVLRMVPGFEMGMRDLGYTRIGIRGVTTPNSEKVKILIDEIPVNENLEGSGTVIFGELPVDDIERIEIIRGPGSSLYGDSAFVGVINIITKKAGDIDGCNLGLKGGSFNTREGSLRFGKTVNDFKLKAYFNYLYTDGGEIAIEEDALTNDPVNGAVGLAGTDRGHTIEGRKKVTAGLNFSYKDLYFRGFYVNFKKKHYLGPSGTVTEESEPKASQLNLMLGYKSDLSEKIEIEPRLYLSIYKADNLWQSYPPGYRANGVTYPHGQFAVNSATQRKIGTDIKITYNISDNNTVTLGVSYKSIKFVNDGDYSNIGSPDLTKDNLAPAASIMQSDPGRNVFSAFIQDQWDISEKVAFTAGVRYDHYDDTNSTVNPRFALIWKPVEKAAFKLLYGHAFRVPTFVELHLNYGNGFVTGNEQNKPETIRTLEAEFSYNFSEKLRFRANYFHNRINDLILQQFFFDDNGVLYNIEYRNVDAVTAVQGIEAELKAFFGEYSYAFVNYSCRHGKNKETKEKLVGMASHILNAGLNVGFFERMNLNLTANVVGSRERDAFDIRKRLKGYALVNAALIWKEPVKNIDILAAVYNVFNADCRTPDPGGSLPNDYPLPNSARSFLLGFNYNF